MRLCLACAQSVGVADVEVELKTITGRTTNGDCETTNCRNAYPALNVRPASHSPTNFALSSRMARGVLSSRIDNYRGLDGLFGIRALSVGILGRSPFKRVS